MPNNPGEMVRKVGNTSGLAGLYLESSAARDLPLAALQRLARETQVVNPRLGLTGELGFERGRFTLALEGRADILLPLAARILADPRHKAIRILGFGAIAERRFTGWRTTGISLDEADALRFAATASRPGRSATGPLGALGA
jgi:hypothetical protein